MEKSNQQDVQGKSWTAIFRKLYRIYDIRVEKTGCGIQALDAMTSWRPNAVSGSTSHGEVPGNLDILNSHTGIFSNLPIFCVLWVISFFTNIFGPFSVQVLLRMSSSDKELVLL